MGPTEQRMSAAHGKRRIIMIAQFKTKEEQKLICTKFSTFHGSRELKEEGSNALDKSQKQTEKNRAKLNQAQ